MKSSPEFKKVISEYLKTRAAQDELFAVTLKKENKNIDECITYILNTVQKSGQNGFADEEIFNMAVHYYDEDDLKVVAGNKNVKAVVNHHIDLSASDLEIAKEKAMERAIEEAKKDLKLSHKVELSPEDLADAKNKAIQLAVEETKNKIP